MHTNYSWFMMTSRRFHTGRLLQSKSLDAHFAEFEFLDFAGHRGGIFIHEDHVTRHFEIGDALAAEAFDFLFGEPCHLTPVPSPPRGEGAAFETNPGANFLAILQIRQTDDLHIGDAW